MTTKLPFITNVSTYSQSASTKTFGQQKNELLKQARSQNRLSLHKRK